MFKITDRTIKQDKFINNNIYVYVKVYHIRGRFCASVNRESRENKDGYQITMTCPFDAISIVLKEARYSDSRLQKYATAILANFDKIVDDYLKLNPDNMDDNTRRTFAQSYFWNPITGIIK